ncbi:MAG: hypothetical protein AB200_02815 [Parcubacteria bacterium C7867-005]|nr:MAG: hypothetical protein AB200_02815 [Parcubacteria bacterium C7867-005]
MPQTMETSAVQAVETVSHLTDGGQKTGNLRFRPQMIFSYRHGGGELVELVRVSCPPEGKARIIVLISVATDMQTWYKFSEWSDFHGAMRAFVRVGKKDQWWRRIADQPGFIDLHDCRTNRRPWFLARVGEDIFDHYVVSNPPS